MAVGTSGSDWHDGATAEQVAALRRWVFLRMVRRVNAPES